MIYGLRSCLGSDGVELIEFLVDVESREEHISFMRLSAVHLVELERIFLNYRDIAESQLLSHAVSCSMHERLDENRYDSESFCQVSHDCVEFSLLCFILGQHPRSLLVDVLVGASDDDPDLFESKIELELIHSLGYFAGC